MPCSSFFSKVKRAQEVGCGNVCQFFMEVCCSFAGEVKFINGCIMIGGLIAGVAAAGAKIGGAIRAKKARKKAAKEQRRILDQMNEENESNFLRDYYQSAFDDPTSRSYLKRISGELYDKDKALTNSGVATGSTHENTLAKKQAANEVMSDAVNHVVVNHEAKKQLAKADYMQRKDSIASGQLGVAKQESRDMADSANQIAGGFSQGFGSVGNLLDKSGWLKG